MNDPIEDLKQRFSDKEKSDNREVFGKMDAYLKGYTKPDRTALELEVTKLLFLGRIARALEFANELGTMDLSGAVDAEVENKAKAIAEARMKENGKRTFIGQKAVDSV